MISKLKSCILRYTSFSGRSTRTEYLCLNLFFIILLTISLDKLNSYHAIIAIIASFFLLTNSARRLHDIDKSGWFALLTLLPLINFIIFVHLASKKGSSGKNRFGEQPKDSEFKELYVNKKMLTVGMLGYGSGVPFTLIFITYTFKMAENGINLRDIGLFGLAGLPFTIKFIWAPLVDGLKIPFLHKLGQRRSWLLVSQACLMAIICFFGFLEPKQDMMLIVYMAILLAFVSATYDIAYDAIRVEIIDTDKQGAASGVSILGYRIGMLVAGGISLILADQFSWKISFIIIGATILISTIATLFVKEPERYLKTHEEGKVHFSLWFKTYVIEPFSQFISRHRNWILIILFAVLFKIGDSLLSKMMNPFYQQMGFSKTEVAEITKFYGFLMTIIGGILGGWVVYKIGIAKSLLIFGILQMLSNLSFVWQAHAGHDTLVLTAVITIENLTSAMGTSAFVAYFAYLCDKRYTATQYALLTSFMSLGRWVTNAPSGYLVDPVHGMGLSWETYFIISTVIAIPALFMIKFLKIENKNN